MKKIQDMTSAELRALAAKKEKEELRAEAPQLIENPDFSSVIKLTELIIDEITSGEGTDDDNSQYLYEEVMQALYGPKVFTWINANDK